MRVGEWESGRKRQWENGRGRKTHHPFTYSPIHFHKSPVWAPCEHGKEKEVWQGLNEEIAEFSVGRKY